jgi:hypothetical protein
MSPSAQDLEAVGALIVQLDSLEGGEAEEAQASLIDVGPTAGPALLHALPALGRLGKLCAMDVFEAWRYEPAAPSLIPLLRDEESTVRQWAASLLGVLGHTPAVPELVALGDRLRTEGVSPSWTEPVAVRWALTALGARRPVVPDALASTVEHRVTGDVYPATRLEALLQSLAKADQVVLGFQVWRRHESLGLIWQRHERLGWEFDRSEDWSVNVDRALRAAELEASDLPGDRSDLVVTIEWIDASDEAVAPEG